MPSDGDQLGLDFSAAPQDSDGYTRWQAERRAALEAMARELGLPLGRSVEVLLKDGVLLRGVLRLAVEELGVKPGRPRHVHVELCVGRCTFTSNSVESCVCLATKESNVDV